MPTQKHLKRGPSFFACDPLRLILMLRSDLSELPLGALVKAHKTVRMTQQDFGSDKNDSSDSDQESEPEDLVGKPVGIKAPTLKPRRSIERRSNKHAWVVVFNVFLHTHVNSEQSDGGYFQEARSAPAASGRSPFCGTYTTAVL